MAPTVSTQCLDELTKFLAQMPGANAHARQSAMKSVGYALKQNAKEGVARNRFGWPGLSNLAKATRKYPPKRFGRQHSSRDIVMDLAVSRMHAKIWGSLASVVAYTIDGNGDLFFGFQAGVFGTKFSHFKKDRANPGKFVRVRRANVVGPDVLEIVRRLTEGGSYSISIKQQRYFAALGFAFRAGRTLTIPSRPLVGPAYNATKPTIPGLFAEKFWASLHRQTMGGKTAGVLGVG